MKIGTVKNQPVILTKSEAKINKSEKDLVILGGSAPKMDDILNYNNLAAHKACGDCDKHLNKMYVTAGAGGLAAAGIALLAGSDPKVAVAAGIIGAGAGAAGSKLHLETGMAVGGAIAGACGYLLGEASAVPVFAVIGTVLGAAANEFLRENPGLFERDDDIDID